MKASILVVDDNVDLRELLEVVLKRGGFSVETACNGEEGLALLNQLQSPDLVLVDVQMPDMTGLQFLDEVQKCKKDIFEKSRFAFCTAGEAPDDQRVVGHLNKMTDLKEFVDVVTKLVSQSPRVLHS